MHEVHRRLPALAMIAAAPLLVPVLARAAADGERGVLWEQTVEMEMQGMKMPATTTRVCAPEKDWSAPPKGQGEEHCKVENVKRSGDRMTWTMTCTEPKGTSGEGEIVHRGDSYDGKMAMRTEQGEMRMKMHGKKLGGACDAGEQKRKVAALQKQAGESQRKYEEGMAKVCDDAANQGALQLFAGPGAMCKEPAQVAKLCATLGTWRGHQNLRRGSPDAPQQASKLCKQDMGALRVRVCAASLKEATPTTKDDALLQFVGDTCPDETKALAQRECAGRGYTGVHGSYRGFCTRYARAELEAGGGRPPSTPAAQEPAPKKDVKDEAIEKGKGLMKGLFGG